MSRRCCLGLQVWGAVAALTAVLWCPEALAGGGVTPAQIASGWQTVSGGLEAKVVYWDESLNGLAVLDLTTGAATEIRSGEYSLHKIPCWSPDGSRIFVRGNSHIIVMDPDGTNAVEETSFSINYNQGGWWNGDGNDWVVALADGTFPYAIKRYRIDAGNHVVETVTVVDEATVGTARGYATMSGDYVAWWDENANSPYGNPHRSVVRNWKTSVEYYALPGDENCCDIHLKHDGSGDYIYSYHHHFEPAPVQTFGGTYATRIAELASVQGEEKWHIRFSNHDDYLIYRDGTPVGSGMRAWVRRLSDGGSVYLGTGVVDPDIWVDTTPPDAITVTSPNGGESWTEGDTVAVTWTSEGSVGNVDIDLSTNGGGSWTALVAGTANDGSESLTVPQVEGTSCRIRVSEGDGSPSDASDGDFTILYIDTDSDGMPDWWENDHGLSPGSDDSGLDPDSDGLTNIEEYDAGTDPDDEDTDNDGLKDGEDPDPLRPPGGHTEGGGCSPGGAFPATAPLALVLFIATVRNSCYVVKLLRRAAGVRQA